MSETDEAVRGDSFPADLVLSNGRVITSNESRDVVSAMAVARGRILAVGSDADVARFIGKQTTVLDVGQRTVAPGFIDNHIHMTNAYQRRWADCSYPRCRSIPDIVEVLTERAASTAVSEWVVARGFDHRRLSEGRYPTRLDLDTALPDHMVAICDSSGMGWTFNTSGLVAIGAYESTEDPPGGPMTRDPAGRPLGPMWDTARTVYVNPNLPSPDLSEIVAGYDWLTGELARVGITTAHEAGYRRADQLRGWQILRETQSLRVRIHLGPYPLHGSSWDEDGAAGCLVRSGATTGFGDDSLRVGSLQMGVDGSLSGGTAALLEPYANRPGDRGSFRVDQGTLDTAIARAIDGGWQVGPIPMGDAGIDRVLTSLERAPSSRLPPRLEHAYVWNERLMERAAKLGVIWNTQPIHLAYDAPFLKSMLGRRARWAYPFRSMFERGITISGGSDWGVAPFNPMLGIDALVHHRSDITTDAPPSVESEAMDLLDAFWIHTMGGAIAGGEAASKGSIEPGKVADFVLLDRNVEASPGSLLDTEVVRTYVGGSMTYRSSTDPFES